MDANNCLFYVGHVENSSLERKENYRSLCERLSKTFEMLETKSILLENVEDLELYLDEFPFFKINHYIYDNVFTNFGGMLSDGYSTTFANIKFPRWMGEIGLLLSLYRGLKKFIETDKEFILWIEDDTKAYDHFENNLFIYSQYFPENFDFISLGAREDQKLLYTPYISNYEINNRIFCKIFSLYWAGAILISRKGALKFLKEFEEKSNTYPWDWLIFNIRSKNVDAQKYETYSIKLDMPQLFYLDLEISPSSTIIDTTHIF